MTLQLLHSEFPYICGKFDFLFYQCIERFCVGSVWELAWSVWRGDGQHPLREAGGPGRTRRRQDFHTRGQFKQIRPRTAKTKFRKFMCLWTNYIFPRWVCLFCCRKYVERSWDYINRSQKNECGNWDRGSAIPRKGIHKWDCRCSVAAEGRFRTAH